MTFDDENKPKSQDIPNTQVPQASGDEVEPQSGAVGANAGGLEETDAKEAAVQLGHNARQADSETTQMFNPNDYAQWNSFQDSTRQMPSAAQLQEQQTDSSQTYISTVPPVEEAQPKKRKKLSKIVVFAVIAAAVFMLLASVVTASDITVPLIAVLAFIPALLSVLGGDLHAEERQGRRPYRGICRHRCHCGCRSGHGRQNDRLHRACEGRA